MFRCSLYINCDCLNTIILIYQTGPLTQALIGVVAKKKFNCPLYIWTWDIWPDSVYAYGFKKRKLLGIVLDFLVGLIYQQSHSIWVSSPGFIKVIKKYSKPKTPLHFIPNWVQKTTANSNVTIQFEKGYNITFTGNIGKVQNLENVLLGFKFTVNKLPNLRLNLVGDGSVIDNLKKKG